MRLLILLTLCCSVFQEAHQIFFPIPTSSFSGNKNKTSRPEVKVAQGRLLGRSLVSAKGTKFYAFSGIPYAAPPVGDLRFKAPRPPKPWFGVRDARTEGRICTQPLLNFTRILFTRIPDTIAPLYRAEIPGLIRARPWIVQAVTNIFRSGEDCLYLNVYAPREAVKSGGALPVLFFVYGGGFVWGEGGITFYDPDLLMDHGMVVVTFNYRLGPLGFLSLGPGTGVPGNAGVKDAAAALRWVRTNIAAFGGDPNKITVYGESAGAVISHILLLSPDTSDMIRGGGVLSSGSATHWWATVPAGKALKRARRFAPSVHCKGSVKPRDLLKCLRKVPPHLLSIFQERGLLPEDLRYVTGAVAFVPAVEDPDDELDPPDHPILTEDPWELVRSGRQAKVPVMLGFNSGEALVMYTGLTRDPSIESLRLMDRNITCLLRDDLLQRMSLAQAEEIGHRVRRLYFGNEDQVNPYNPSSFGSFFEMLTSFFIYLDTLTLARYLVADPSATRVFVYRFEFVGALNMFKNALRIKSKDACHGDELPYIWRMNLVPESRPLSPTAPEFKVRDTFSTLVANFVKTGSPTVGESRQLQNVSWPPFTAMDHAYLSIDAETRVGRDFRRSTLDFWDELYQKFVGGPIWSRVAALERQRSLDVRPNLVNP